MPPFVPRKHERLRSISPSAQRSNRIRADNNSGKKKATLFDTSDSLLKPAPSVNDNRAFLQSLEASEDSSGLSDAESGEFEDVLDSARPAKRAKFDIDEEEAEDEMDWEDAIGQEHVANSNPNNDEEPTGDLELTLDQARTWGTFKDASGSKKGPSKIERQIRISTHCMHVQFLMFHNFIRNSWTCDSEIQRILYNHLTPGVQKEVDRWRKSCGTTIEKTEKKDTDEKKIQTDKVRKSKKATKSQRDWGESAEPLEEGTPDLSRGDPTLRLLKILSAFWRKRFKIVAPGLRKQGYKSLTRLEAELKAFQTDKADIEEHGERIDNLKAFRNLATQCEGSRDVGAQLFTALVRSIGLKARLVASLQPIGFAWTKIEEANEILKKPNLTQISKQIPRKSSTNGAASKAKPIPGQAGTGAMKDDPIKISDSESDLSTAPSSPDDSAIIAVRPDSEGSGKRYDRDLRFPIYWTEVLSPVSHKWIPVDSIVTSTIAHNEEQLAIFEPRGTKADNAKQVIAYVVAFCQDGVAKEVTTRYLKRHMWPGKTKGVRMPVEKIPVYNKRGKIKKYEDYDWFKTIMSGYTRHKKQRDIADDLEDATDLLPAKFEKKSTNNSTETLQGYKNSAEFVLERHLRREEALLPHAQVVKQFLAGKGNNAKEEPVYRREDVVICKTVESWHKEGREIKAGSQPLKYVPTRAVTLLRKREIEEAERDTGEKAKQPLYSKDQTDWIIPPPIENGVIPKNAFGNIDIYVKSMVPKGAIHIPFKGTAKICKKLDINFAEACTGFEFGHQRAIPVLTGVVVAVENKNLVVDAWRAAETEKKLKEAAKRAKIALNMWKKMLTGMRIIEDLSQKYGDEADAYVQDAIHPMSRRKKSGSVKHQSTEPLQHDGAIVPFQDPGLNACSTDEDLASGLEDAGVFVDGDKDHETWSGNSHGREILLDDGDDNPDPIEDLGRFHHYRKPKSVQSPHHVERLEGMVGRKSREMSTSSSRLSDADSESSFGSSEAYKAHKKTSTSEEPSSKRIARNTSRRSTLVIKSHYFAHGSNDNSETREASARGTEERAKLGSSHGRKVAKKDR